MEEEFIALNQSKIILNEMYSFNALNSKTYDGDEPIFGGKSFCIAISPDGNRWDGYLPNPYFKLCNADSIYGSTGISRICFRVPHIENHTYCPEIKITKKVLEDLNRAIRYRYNFRGQYLSVLQILNIGIRDMLKGTKHYNLYKDVVAFPDFTVLEGYKNSSNAIDIFKNRR